MQTDIKETTQEKIAPNQEEKEVSKGKKAENDFPHISVNPQDNAVESLVSNFAKNANYRVPDDKMEQLIEQMRQLAVNVEQMRGNGDLEKIQAFKKTDNIYLLVIQGRDGKDIESEARFSAKRDNDGNISLGVSQKQELNLEKYFGHTFTEQEKENLLKAGNAGMVINADFSRNGQTTPVLVSLDKLTNQLISANVDKIKISDKFLGVEITSEQKEKLLSGQAVYLKDMVSSKGNKFSTEVQYNAERRGLQPVFSTEMKIGGKLIPEVDKELIEKGMPVLVENMVDGKGKIYTAYVHRDQETGKLKFNKNDPKNVVAVSNEHTTQVAANTKGQAPKELERTVKSGQPVVAKQSNKQQAETAKKVENKPKLKLK